MILWTWDTQRSYLIIKLRILIHRWILNRKTVKFSRLLLLMIVISSSIVIIIAYSCINDYYSSYDFIDYCKMLHISSTFCKYWYFYLRCSVTITCIGWVINYLNSYLQFRDTSFSLARGLIPRSATTCALPMMSSIPKACYEAGISWEIIMKIIMIIIITIIIMNIVKAEQAEQAEQAKVQCY